MTRPVAFSFLSAILLTATSVARADVVFSLLKSPGDTFDTNNSQFIEGPNALHGQALNVAAPFSFLGTNAYTLTSANLPLRLYGTENVANIWLFSDNGKPNTILTSTTITNMPQYPAGPTLLTATFDGTFVLQPNTTYWLGVGTVGESMVEWYANQLGVNGFADNGTGNWINWGLTTPAFRINGTLVPSTGPDATAVPLPNAATAALSLLPLVLLAKSLRRRQNA